MSAPPVLDSAATRPQDVLDTAIGTARAGGRLDLVDRLSTARSLLRAPSVTVQVAGGAPQGRTDMVTALLRAAPGSPGITLTQAGAAGPGEAADIVVFVADSARILTT